METPIDPRRLDHELMRLRAMILRGQNLSMQDTLSDTWHLRGGCVGVMNRLKNHVKYFLFDPELQRRFARILANVDYHFGSKPADLQYPGHIIEIGGEFDTLAHSVVDEITELCPLVLAYVMCHPLPRDEEHKEKMRKLRLQLRLQKMTAEIRKIRSRSDKRQDSDYKGATWFRQETGIQPSKLRMATLREKNKLPKIGEGKLTRYHVPTAKRFWPEDFERPIQP